MIDANYADHAIETVEANEHGFIITFDGGWCFGGVTRKMIEAAGADEPKVGDSFRIYGNPHRSVRGVMLNGVMLYYRTDVAEAAKRHRDQLAEDAKKQAQADHNREAYDAERATMPEVFQRRLARFEKANPLWRRDFESYELSCCRDALLIAAALKTAEAVVGFSKMKWAEQQAAVPGLFDGHSGNSFGFSVRLAHDYLTDPERVVQEHGALCALVGCKDYGDEGKEGR